MCYVLNYICTFNVSWLCLVAENTRPNLNLKTMKTDTKPTENTAENGNKSKPLLAVVFAQWIAEDHFRLYNIENGVYYWKNEDEIQTTEELFERFNRYQKAVNCNHNFIGDVCEKCSVMKFG